tara:strand:- start:14101 stop:14970 length:870 start_codon:yes stop_codon:yes gene_type:complete
MSLISALSGLERANISRNNLSEEDKKRANASIIRGPQGQVTGLPSFEFGYVASPTSLTTSGVPTEYRIIVGTTGYDPHLAFFVTANELQSKGKLLRIGALITPPPFVIPIYGHVYNTFAPEGVDVTTPDGLMKKQFNAGVVEGNNIYDYGWVEYVLMEGESYNPMRVPSKWIMKIGYRHHKSRSQRGNDYSQWYANMSLHVEGIATPNPSSLVGVASIRDCKMFTSTPFNRRNLPVFSDRVVWERGDGDVGWSYNPIQYTPPFIIKSGLKRPVINSGPVYKGLWESKVR